jgi:hypothetical protein
LTPFRRAKSVWGAETRVGCQTRSRLQIRQFSPRRSLRTPHPTPSSAHRAPRSPAKGARLSQTGRHRGFPFGHRRHRLPEAPTLILNRVLKGLIAAGHEPAAHSINSPLSPSATACGMLCAPSLMRRLRRWLLTESTEWPSQTAVSRLVSPSAARARTWSSAGVSSSQAGVVRRGEVRVGIAAEAPLELVTGDRAVMPVRPFVAPVLIPHPKRPRAPVDVERLRDPVGCQNPTRILHPRARAAYLERPRRK